LRAGDLQGQILWRDNETRKDAAGNTKATYGGRTADLRCHEDKDLFVKIAEGIGVLDPATRDQALDEMYKVLWDEHLELAIGYANLPWAVGPRIADWKPWK
jgi:hypothetical protein